MLAASVVAVTGCGAGKGTPPKAPLTVLPIRVLQVGFEEEIIKALTTANSPVMKSAESNIINFDRRFFDVLFHIVLFR